MRKNTSGFTIIELTIVIIIIAILASIVLVSYNGIRDRAENTKTADAANQWIKAIKMYKIKSNNFPSGKGCLGTGYGYNLDNLGATGVGMCYQSDASTGIVENSDLYTAISKHMDGKPTPAMITASINSTNWRRGIYYTDGGSSTGTASIGAVFKGKLDKCPSVADISGTPTQMGLNTVCEYPLGIRDGYV